MRCIHGDLQLKWNHLSMLQTAFTGTDAGTQVMDTTSFKIL